MTAAFVVKQTRKDGVRERRRELGRIGEREKEIQRDIRGTERERERERERDRERERE